MPFREEQVKLLSGRLDEKFVRTREQAGKSLSYIEGWHVIAEANRIFGFDGWDRETVSAECVWQELRREPKACAYATRVRIRVRAGDGFVIREGSGVGQGTGSTLGEAHESALKEAETDATKRALATFGNLFGLALYDKEQAGVRRRVRRTAVKTSAISLSLFTAEGEEECRYEMPESFCAGMREALAAATPEEIERLWARNAPTINRLRAGWPELKTVNGTHYADVLERLYEHHLARSRSGVPASGAGEPAGSVDKSELAVGEPKRVRDVEHLRFIASLPCLVCGRTPSHAHHLRFAQPRSLGSKVSDEWSVPLCALHHRALHDVGSEERWWIEHGIDAQVEAQRLWQQRKSPDAPTIDSAAE
jgi:DNA recombination protein Rad52